MIELACIANDKYLRHAAAMVHSALTSSPATGFSVNVLHDCPISNEDRERFERVVEPFDARVTFRLIDPADVNGFPGGSYWPRAVWFRIFLPLLLPAADRVLYLDSDLIVTGELGHLWSTDVGTHLLGAVTNPLYPFMPSHHADMLGIADPAEYFNSGVLLMNLHQMRAEDTVSRLRDYALASPHIPYPDQDTLNAVCKDRWLHLHPRWNVQSTMFELAPHQLPVPADQLREALADPAIVHFIGPFKPWQYLCRHPRRSLYFDHARATPWGEPKIEGRGVRNAILRRLSLESIDRWMQAERATKEQWSRVRRRAAAKLRRS